MMQGNPLGTSKTVKAKDFASRRCRMIGSAVVAALGSAGLPAAAFAADSTWNVTTGGAWSLGSNWTAGSPGLNDGSTTSVDVATFGTAISAARGVTIDASRNIFSINFAGNSSAYTLTGGNLLLTNGGNIQTSGGGSPHTDLIQTAIAIQGDGGTATFTAGSTSATRLLSISGGITGVSTGSNVTALTIDGTGTGNNTLSGIIGDGVGGGKLSITKGGTGNWVLSGANTFSGGITLNSGTLTLGNNAALGTGVLTINGGVLDVTGARSTTNNNGHVWNADFGYGGTATLNTGTGGVSLGVNAGDTRTVSVSASTMNVGGIISDGTHGTTPTINLAKTGAGTLALTGNNTFSGVVLVNQGTLSLSGNNAFTAATVSGGTLSFTGSSTNANLTNVTINGGTANFNGGSNAALSAININSGTMNVTVATSAGTTSTGILIGDTSGSNNASMIVTNGSADFSMTRNVTIVSGNTGTSTYGGSWSGTLNHTLGGTLTLGSTGSTGKGVSIGLGNSFGTLIISATIADPGGLVGAAAPITITGGGNGTVRLTGSNSFAGGINLNGGKLAFNNGNALGTGTLTVNGGNFNQLFGAFSNSRNNAMVWNTNFTSDGSLTVDLGAGAVNLGSTGTDTTRIVTSNNSGSTGNTGFAVRGVISDGTNGTTINLTKSGTGVLTLGGASNYTGDTAVTAGILRLISGANRLPTTTTLSIQAGARVDIQGNSQSLQGLADISGGGIFANTGGAATLTITDTGSFSGAITNGANAVNVTKTTGGTQTLSAAQGYSGSTNVSGGVLVVGGSAAATVNGLTASAANGATTVSVETDGLVVGQRISGTSIASGTYIRSIDTGADTIVISAATTGIVSSINALAYGAAGTGAINVTGGELQVNGSTLSTQTATVNGGALTGTGTVAGAVNATGNASFGSSATLTLGSTLNVTGTGNQLTTGTLAVTGLTTVAASAELAVNGTLNGAASVAGTLKGTGTTGAVTTTSAGTVAAGNSIGTLSTGTLDMTAGGTFAAEIDTGTLQADKVAITGDLKLFGDLAQLSLTDLGPDAAVSGGFTLITYTGSWDFGTFAGLADDSNIVLGSNTYTINYNDSVDGLNAVTLAVPEPGSLSLLALAGGALLARRRGRRQK